MSHFHRIFSKWYDLKFISRRTFKFYRCSRMIGKEQRKHIASLKYRSPVLGTRARILTDIPLLIPIVQHGSRFFVPVTGIEVLDGSTVFWIDQSTKNIRIRQRIPSKHTGDRRIAFVDRKQHCHIRFTCLHFLKYSFQVLWLLDGGSVYPILLHQILTHEDRRNTAPLNLNRHTIQKSANTVAFQSLFPEDSFQISTVLINQPGHIHNLPGVHILHRAGGIRIENIDLLIPCQHQLQLLGRARPRQHHQIQPGVQFLFQYFVYLGLNPFFIRLLGAVQHHGHGVRFAAFFPSRAGLCSCAAGTTGTTSISTSTARQRDCHRCRK